MENPQTFLTGDQFIQLGWVTLYLVIAIAIPMTIVGGIAYWRSSNPAESFSNLVISAQVLKMTTVILIVFAVTMLMVIGILGSEGGAGILGSIAGYVLGGVVKSEKEAKVEN